MRYWKRYDARYKLGNIKNLYYFIQSKARKLGKPFDRKSNRGRPYAINPYEYVAIFIISTLLDFSLRDDEFLSDSLFGKHIDHSTFGKAFLKIPYHYLKKLLTIIRNEINSIIGNNSIPILIADSTGVRTDRLYVPTIVKCKLKKRRVTNKMNIIAEYYPEEKAIVIANADAFFVSDAYSAIRMLNESEVTAKMLFADAGFDCEELFEKCFKRQIKPIIKQREYDKEPRKYRKKALEIFDKELYRKFRGIIEGIFGGLETRRLLFTRYKKKSMRMKHIIAMAIVHNINTYMAISLFILIFSTTSLQSQYKFFKAISIWLCPLFNMNSPCPGYRLLT